jgi:thiol-disulfide isomerase/thioredoxin
MNIAYWSLLFALFCVHFVVGKEIRELDDQSFKSSLEADNEGLWLIYFHAVSTSGSYYSDLIFIQPWCGFCKKMTPIMEEIAAQHPNAVTVAKIDATAATETASEFKIKTYPTIKYYKNGRFGSYEGNKSFDGLDSFIVRMHGKCFLHLRTHFPGI